MSQNDLDSNDSQLLFAGVGFLIGTVLVTIGSLLVPRAPDISHISAMQRVFGENVCSFKPPLY